MKRKGEITLERRLYGIGEFARRAGVTVRTLRFYDRVALLAPSGVTGAGYRLYADEDLQTLQHILALKFLGFSLAEIKGCLGSGPAQVEEMLARQRRMMQDRRSQLDAILRAIESAERLVSAGRWDAEAIIGVIEVIQMQQKKAWVRQYFSEEQAQKLEATIASSYSEEARRKLAAREWTEADQADVSAQWTHVAAEAKRLAAAGADPACEEGQALAQRKHDLLFAFTQGDPDIAAGLKTFWEQHNALPAGEQPLAAAVPRSVVPDADDPGAQFLARAMTAFQEQRKKGEEAG